MDLGMGMEMDRCFQELEPEMSAMNLSDGDPIAVLTELNHRLRNMNPPESHPKMEFVVERTVGVLLNHRLRNMNPPESHPKMKFVVQKSLEAVGVLLSKIERAYENLGFDTHLMNQIIVYHFYREGLFYAARYYAKRAGVVPTEILKQFELGKCMLKLLKAMDVDTALNWVSANRERYDNGAKLELGLHKLKYVGLFAGSENLEDPTVLEYAKTHFGTWAKLNQDKCKKVFWEASRARMACCNGGLDHIPMDRLVGDVWKMFCQVTPVTSSLDPLEVAIAGGEDAVLTLRRFFDQAEGEGQLDRNLRENINLRDRLVAPRKYDMSPVRCPLCRKQCKTPILLKSMGVVCNGCFPKYCNDFWDTI